MHRKQTQTSVRAAVELAAFLIGQQILPDLHLDIVCNMTEQ